MFKTNTGLPEGPVLNSKKYKSVNWYHVNTPELDVVPELQLWRYNGLVLTDHIIHILFKKAY